MRRQTLEIAIRLCQTHVIEYLRALLFTINVHHKLLQRMSADTSVPLNYYAVFHHLNQLIPKDAIIVSEGANTMDIGRAMLPNELPRHRLDAGTFGTMGVSNM